MLEKLSDWVEATRLRSEQRQDLKEAKEALRKAKMWGENTLDASWTAAMRQTRQFLVTNFGHGNEPPNLPYWRLSYENRTGHRRGVYASLNMYPIEVIASSPRFFVDLEAGTITPTHPLTGKTGEPLRRAVDLALYLDEYTAEVTAKQAEILDKVGG